MEGGFDLRSRLSNSTELELFISGTPGLLTVHGCDNDKVLGHVCKKKDFLALCPTPLNPNVSTKRELLFETSKYFDPLWDPNGSKYSQTLPKKRL